METVKSEKKRVLVYPVHSRRAGGLSVGINLFPEKKICSFDCPYCEVFPFSSDAHFSAKQMEDDLRSTVAGFLAKGLEVKDICFSGSGEPTMSKDFPEALERAAKVRSELAANAKLVLITNGTGLLDGRLFNLLANAAGSANSANSADSSAAPALDIWLKLDAGTPEWYKNMSRCDIPFDNLIEKIKAFTASAPVTIQTMICAVEGKCPPPEENAAWVKLMLELAASQPPGGVRKVQIYGKARASPEDPLASALPVAYLEDRAATLRRFLVDSFPRNLRIALNVEVYP